LTRGRFLEMKKWKEKQISTKCEDPAPGDDPVIRYEGFFRE